MKIEPTSLKIEEHLKYVKEIQEKINKEFWKMSMIPRSYFCNSLAEKCDK